MVHLIKQPTHTHEIITKEGEVKILLEITINVNATGVPTVEVASSPVETKKTEESRWAIPSFKTDQKIKFGKKVEE